MESRQKEIIKDMFNYYVKDEEKIFKKIDQDEIYFLLTKNIESLLTYRIFDKQTQFIRIDEKNKCLRVDIIINDVRSFFNVENGLKSLSQTNNAEIVRQDTQEGTFNAVVKLYDENDKKKKHLKLIFNFVDPVLLTYECINLLQEVE